MTKPIRSERLLEEMDHSTSGQTEVKHETRAPAHAATPASAEAFDAASALERVEGDADLLNDLIQIFLDDLPRQMDMLRKAVEEQNPKNIEQEAHRLKGAAGSLGAMAVWSAASRLEQAGRAANRAAAGPAWAALEAEIARLEPALREFHPEAAL